MKNETSDFVILMVVLAVLVICWVSWINVASKTAIARDNFISEMTKDLPPENKCLVLCLDKYFDVQEKREVCSEICLNLIYEKGEVKKE